VLGDVSPGLFIPVAERAGLVGRLTRVLLEKALAAAAAWPDGVRLSFNLSANDISSSEGVVRLVGILSSSGFDPRRVEFEITETAMMYDFEQSKASIEALRQMGCGIALDDFGTGFSSLSQLHALPLTKIKIDRSFVSSIDTTPASYKIVKSLLTLSGDMGLDCVVEGVETGAELSTLDKLGARLIQGYYFSAPVPESEIGRFLSEPFPVQASSRRKA
jgi:predicted signal transduction protein with EAL and GGDEF domain